ncbi:MAG TPA: DUF1080 domain-containing protein [Planctomycetaceae bacterium]|nr:DUF1080 domain-containing protein [Planctomycetaceae bacterium]
MNRARRAVLLVLAVLIGAGTFALRAGDEKANDGWEPLFNGKDLAGWKASEGVEWKVDNGEIVTPPKRSHLFTDREFKNFEFKADVMTTPGSNSGLYFHTKFEDTFPNNGYESQVNQTHGDPVKSGSLYFVVKLFSTPVKDNEWYTHQIIVKGKQITVKINDKTLFEYVEPDGVTGTRKLSKGSFAIQAHDPKSVVYYKNIMVKPLPD